MLVQNPQIIFNPGLHVVDQIHSVIQIPPPVPGMHLDYGMCSSREMVRC